MAQQIGNGMCLASARRALHQHAIAMGQVAGNMQLLAIGRFAQQNLGIFVALRPGLRQCRLRPLVDKPQDLHQRRGEWFASLNPPPDIFQH